MKGNKALKRALKLKEIDVVRITSNVPLITDSTEWLTPETAQEMLNRNKNNRPVNWDQVEKYSILMKKGEWKFHSQGIILDDQNNIITGQTRLWAIVYAGVSIPMRISRGNPPDTAFAIDRGRPQSARDLATRCTERKHTQIEYSIARAICVLRGNRKPSADDVASMMVENSILLEFVMKETRGTAKSKSVLMILAAICESCQGNRFKEHEIRAKIQKLEDYVIALETRLGTHRPDECWGKGTAFSMALEQAKTVIG